MHIGIIGAGMAGLSCAARLRVTGHSVKLFDKARGPGGRMSTRRFHTEYGDAAFDHGAQYFTARDPRFREQLNDWVSRGLAVPWPEAAADAWVGVPGMNALVRDLMNGSEVEFGWTVTGVERNQAGWWVSRAGARSGPFQAMILAVPAEQAIALLSLHDFGMAREAFASPSLPCWTAMFAFAEPLLTDRHIIRGAGPAAWVARNRCKPGRTGPDTWVVQADATWSAKAIEAEPGAIVSTLGSALSAAIDVPLPPTLVAAAHRWRFARSAALGKGPLWNSRIGLGACGDWLLGPRVECAWLSGHELANCIID